MRQNLTSIPANPPKEALQAKHERANLAVRGEYVHQIPKPDAKKVYRPGRKTAKRQDRKDKQ